MSGNSVTSHIRQCERKTYCRVWAFVGWFWDGLSERGFPPDGMLSGNGHSSGIDSSVSVIYRESRLEWGPSVLGKEVAITCVSWKRHAWYLVDCRGILCLSGLEQDYQVALSWLTLLWSQSDLVWDWCSMGMSRRSIMDHLWAPGPLPTALRPAVRATPGPWCLIR